MRTKKDYIEEEGEYQAEQKQQPETQEEDAFGWLKDAANTVMVGAAVLFGLFIIWVLWIIQSLFPFLVLAIIVYIAYKIIKGVIKK